MSAPRKLPDGTWSDGVNRQHRVHAEAFGALNMERFAVLTCKCHGGWGVYKGVSGLASFDTHAEAIAYADKAARNA